MATYVVLVNFTDQGIRNVKDSPKRLGAFKALAKKLGVTVKATYYTVGAHDIVTIVDGPDEAVAATLLKVGSLGNVRTQTMRACSPDEFEAIVKKLP